MYKVRKFVVFWKWKFFFNEEYGFLKFFKRDLIGDEGFFFFIVGVLGLYNVMYCI